MKTVFKNILAILILVISLISCSKDDSPPQPDPKMFEYRVKEERVNNILTASYEYNNKNQITKATNGVGLLQSILLYNSGGFLVEVILNDGELRESFVRDTNGRLLETIFSTNNNLKTKFKYSYDTAGNQTEEKVYRYITATNTFNNEFTNFYVYNSKNQLINEVTPEYTDLFSGDIVLGESKEYEYDERGNIKLKIFRKARVSGGNLYLTSKNEIVYDNIKPTDYLNSTLSKNNKIQSVYTNFLLDGSIGSQTNEISTHTYNEAGYITKTETAPNNNYIQTYTLEKIN
jgi:hypothetical protein